MFSISPYPLLPCPLIMLTCGSLFQVLDSNDGDTVHAGLDNLAGLFTAEGRKVFGQVMRPCLPPPPFPTPSCSADIRLRVLISPSTVL